MTEHVLVTGGAGFIGSHLVDALAARGHVVRVFDSLEPQVHGPLREQGRWPDYANADAEYILGDVRDREGLGRALEGIDVIYHLAAATGVGQSMYQIGKYVEVNVQGTANLLDALANSPRRVRKLVLASSRAVYGEGAYVCEGCGLVHPTVRSPAQLDAGEWELPCPRCGGSIAPVPTPETLPPDPGSIYGVTKLAQEQLCLVTGRTYGLEVTALRLFNVYGPRQSPSNPYTGIFTAFLGRLAAGEAPEVYEDGLMTRDFVHVSDAVRAFVAAAETQPESTRGGRGDAAREYSGGTRGGEDAETRGRGDAAREYSGETRGGVYNIGSGRATAILEVARVLCDVCAVAAVPRVSGAARVGDIRHCSADNAAAGVTLGYTPAVELAAGLATLRTDDREGPAADLTVARRELAQAGLLR
jgi:dTDP-L-rhamnose 4-epimerase